MNQSDFLNAYHATPIGATLDLRGAEVLVEDEITLRHGRTVRDAVFRHSSAASRIEIKSQADGLGHQRGVLEGCRIIGHDQDGIGLLVSSPNVRLRDLYITGASRGLEIGRLAYLLRLEDLVVRDCGTGVWFNAERHMRGRGENVSAFGCSFSGNTRDGVMLNRARLSMFACSVDYNGRYGVIQWAGAELKSVACHFETELGREHVHDADQSGNSWLDWESKIHKIDHSEAA